VTTPARGLNWAVCVACMLGAVLFSLGPASVAGARTASAAAQPKKLFGFNTYTTPTTIAQQKMLGANTTRLFADWAVVEPSAGQWNWQQSDQEYTALVAAGLRPLIVAFTSPCWARPSMGCNDSLYTGPPDPAYDQDWAAYVRALAARYPAAIGIEVWNEPNLDQYFWPHANPARFTTLLAEAYDAVKAVNPQMPVISGGLLLSPPVQSAAGGGEGDTQFLASMYAAGARSWMDALGVHIYPSDYGPNDLPLRWDPAAMAAWLNALSPVRNAAGAGAEPLWITEMGVSTATQPGFPAAATPAEQSADLVAMVREAQADPEIPVVIIHTLQDESTNLAAELLASLMGPMVGMDAYYNQVAAGFGVLDADGTPKPAACALSVALHGSLSC
jgi:hypothetical protein